MVIKSKIEEWENIFLDTNAIVQLLLHQKNAADPRAKHMFELVSFLSNHKSKNKKDRTFFVSAISLSEILVDEMDEERAAKTVALIGSQDVEFVAFDEMVATKVSGSFRHLLFKKELNRFALEVGWKSNELVMAREWINRDYMIAMSALGASRPIDVILTTDKRTFIPICNNLGIFSALCEQEQFNRSSELFFEYQPLDSQKEKAKSIETAIA